MLRKKFDFPKRKAHLYRQISILFGKFTPTKLNDNGVTTSLKITTKQNVLYRHIFHVKQ